MPARDPDYRPPPDVTPAFCTGPAKRPGCGTLLPPSRAGLCNECAGKLPEAVRCKRCRSTDRSAAHGCVSNFHADNRTEA